MKRAVKYCGGCNPRFDRAALVRQLESGLGERLPGVQPDQAYDEVYVICGCPSRCADCSAFRAEKLIVLDSPEQLTVNKKEKQ